MLKVNWNLKSLYKDQTALISFTDLLRRDLHTITEKMEKVNPHELDELINLFDSIQELMSGTNEVDDFLFCIYAENVEDDEVAYLIAKSSELKASFNFLLAELEQLLVKLPENIYTELMKREEVMPYRFYIEECKNCAKDKLPMALEKAISQLSVNGFDAWEDHYELMLSKLRIQEGKESLSIGQALNLVHYSNDKTKRQRLAKSIGYVCKQNEDNFAAILNNISGYRLDIYKLRGWDNPLKEMLDKNRIGEETIHTMLQAIEQSKEMFQRYLERKARVERKANLAWYDTLVPSFSSKANLKYEEAVEIVLAQFYRFDEKLGLFAERAFENGWIEAENRSNKMPGAFCANLPVSKESRIFMTFSGNYQDVVTLAHELGHAYHNSILHNEPAFAQQKGTSVAETASTFTENLVIDAAIDLVKTKEEKLALLETKIISGLTYIGIIPAMFEFEQQFYQKRTKGILTAKEISDLMDKAEESVYGNTVDERNIYDWITTGHFYDTEKAFFNIPYTIGYLFSNGVYSLAKQQGTGFMKQYDGLLRNSGRMSVEDLAFTYLDQNIEDIRFWKASIEPIKDVIHTYLELTNEMI